MMFYLEQMEVTHVLNGEKVFSENINANVKKEYEDKFVKGDRNCNGISLRYTYNALLDI